MTEPVFRREGPLLVPTAHASGPWDPGQMHGGAPAALVARAIEQLDAPGPMRCSRLTLEFLGAVPLAPVRVEAQVLRGGPRLQLAEATVDGADGRTLVRARGVRLRVGEVDLAGRGDQRPLPEVPGPQEGEPPDFAAAPGTEGFHLTAMDIRVVVGQFHTPGPALAWFRPRRPFVDDEAPTPLQRVAAAADFGNGIGSELDWGRALFVNTDLTVHLVREPQDGWVLLESRTMLDAEGRGLASSVLWDAQGEVGASHQSLFVDQR